MVNYHVQLLESWIDQNKVHVSLCGEINGTFQRIRENNQGNQLILDHCLIFLEENRRRLTELMGEIDDYRSTIKEIKRVSGRVPGGDQP